MKKIVPSIALSLFSLPLAHLFTYLLFLVFHSLGGATSIYSFVVSLNVIALIMAMAAINNGKSD